MGKFFGLSSRAHFLALVEVKFFALMVDNLRLGVTPILKQTATTPYHNGEIHRMFAATYTASKVIAIPALSLSP